MNNQEEYQHYATGYALTTDHLFRSFPCSKYINNWKLLSPKQKVQAKENVLAVFRYFFKIMLDDIIENNTTFRLPHDTHAFIEMNHIHGEDFTKARQNGSFKEIDFLKSNFCANRLQLRYSTRYHTWKKPIYVGNEMKDRITKYTHERKAYG